VSEFFGLPPGLVAVECQPDTRELEMEVAYSRGEHATRVLRQTLKSRQFAPAFLELGPLVIEQVG
jgi:hypothetical protein